MGFNSGMVFEKPTVEN